MSMLEAVGRRLLPLFQPTRAEDRRALKALTAALEALRSTQARQGEALRDASGELQALRARVTAVRDAVSSGLAGQRDHIDASAHHVELVNRDNLRRLQESVSRNSLLLKRVLGQARHIADHAVIEQQIMRRLGRIAASGRPILVGPWTGEVGFELLYWVPFLRWFVDRFAVDARRLVVISRGGPRSWYGELAGTYVDVLDLMQAGPLDAGAGPLKQRRVGARDRMLIRQVAARGARPHVLHPSFVYRLAAPYLDGMTGVRPLMETLRFSRIVPPSRAMVPGLPQDYVAAKFYFSSAFPDTEENRRFVRQVLTRVSEHLPVVLLNHGAAVDGHSQYVDERFPTLASLGAHLTPGNNLDVQTAAVGHARAFVGTYGGFSYLAPSCGVEAVAFHQVDDFYLHHRHLADVVFARLGSAPLTVMPTHVAELLLESGQPWRFPARRTQGE